MQLKPTERIADALERIAQALETLCHCVKPGTYPKLRIVRCYARRKKYDGVKGA